MIDASGTSGRPHPLGVAGLPVEGEGEAADRVAYGLADVMGADRAHHVGRHTLVIGAGRSGLDVALDFVRLGAEAPGTWVTWATRGGGLADQLPGRGRLGLDAAEAVRSGRAALLSPFAARRIERRADGLVVHAVHDGADLALEVDRIIVATAVRPDLAPRRELRLALDPAVEATPALAPPIAPNLHPCGTVPARGVDELAHPEGGVLVVGGKSCGRAPAVPMATGYERVRSVAAELGGDSAAARQVRLVLPETGVCRVAPAASAAPCCGGPAPERADACCVADAEAKAAGAEGGGCRDAAA